MSQQLGLTPRREHALENLDGSRQRFTALLRSIDDASPIAIGEWSIGETAAHVSHIARIFRNAAGGIPSPAADHLALAETWERYLAEDPERDPLVLADRIDDLASELLTRLHEIDLGDTVVWHGGIELPAYCLACILVNELELHGLDIATSRDRAWEVTHEKAVLALQGLMPVLSDYLKEDETSTMRAAYALHFRKAFDVYAVIDQGRLTVSEVAPSAIDCHISADPVTYILVGYGRMSQWSALLRGKLIAYGRKPWLSLRFPRLFHAP